MLASPGCSLFTGLDALSEGSSDASSSGAGARGGAGGSVTSATASGMAPGSGGASSSSTSSTAPGSGGAASFDPPWFDASWQMRARVVIENHADVTLENGFETGFSVDLGGLFPGATPESLRLGHWEATAGRWYWIPTHVEVVGGSTWVWLPLQEPLEANGGSVSHYWLYAANAAPPPPDDPATIFTLWQPFESLSGWSTSGTPNVSAGRVTLDVNDTVLSGSKFGPNHAVDFEMTIETLPGCSLGCWLTGGFQDQFNAEPWMLWITRDGEPQIWPVVEISARSASFIGSQVPVQLGTSVVFGVERFPEHVHFRRQNQLVADAASWTGAYTSGLPARLAAVGGGKASFDWARVRRAADPPPLVTLENVEIY